MRNTFGGEGDVADLLQLFAQMEMDDASVCGFKITGDRTRRQIHHVGCYWPARMGAECAHGGSQRAL